ncbi:cache domain-containing protein [Zoogloeaceae bacterium G21618-S1]|nr:cache domain-containing protein [Zoogloeaceae bacterium G21618-S1]
MLSNARQSLYSALIAIACALALGAPTANADTSAREVLHSTSVERRAMTLLDRAVTHIKAKGEAGTAAFNHGPEFIDRDLYTYALKTDGTFLASGGGSAALVGQNVLNEVDLNGKPFFREIIEQAKTFGGGRVEYRWFNPADARGEPKVAVFRAVGDVIVAAGYYPPRATAMQAKVLLRDAVNAMAANPEAALDHFQRLNGPFIRDDLYVFVVRLSDGVFLAHGATPSLVGTDAYELISPDGHHIVRRMAEMAKKTQDGETEYAWRNPVSGKVETKHTYFKTVGDTLVAVGYYRR